MFRIVVSLFVFLSVTLSLENTTTVVETVTKNTSADDNILCKSCGVIISTSYDILSNKSPTAECVFEDTLFGREKVLVQVLQSDIFFNFAIITTEHATCVSVGEWQLSELWFPGYRWKPCLCPECGTYIGWVFEPVENNSMLRDGPFYGLILTNLIDESCNSIFFYWVV